MTREPENTDWQHRTRLLAGDAGVEHLRGAAVAIIGLGGVGGYAAEAVARAGGGRLLPGCWGQGGTTKPNCGNYGRDTPCPRL